MAFVLRSVGASLRGSAAISSPALRFAPRAALPAPSFAALRFNSSLPNAPESSSSASPEPSPRRPTLDIASMSHLFPTKAAEEDPDAWWRKTDAQLDRNLGRPGNQYTGRSFPVKNTFEQTSRMLGSFINVTNIKRDHRSKMYYEKPSVLKRRLRSERWRRRFKDEVRKRVQLVQTLRMRQ